MNYVCIPCGTMFEDTPFDADYTRTCPNCESKKVREATPFDGLPAHQIAKELFNMHLQVMRLEEQVKKFKGSGLDQSTINLLAKMEMDVAALMAANKEKAPEQEESQEEKPKPKRFRFHMNSPVTLKKYKDDGYTVKDLLEKDPEYVWWMVRDLDNYDFDDDVREAVEAYKAIPQMP